MPSYSSFYHFITENDEEPKNDIRSISKDWKKLLNQLVRKVWWKLVGTLTVKTVCKKSVEGFSNHLFSVLHKKSQNDRECHFKTKQRFTEVN